jgi:branched-chain amino acid transport system permease protein
VRSVPGAAAARSRALQARSNTWDRIPGWLRPIIWLALSLSILVIPFFDDIWVRMFFLIALYATLGMGLNVVVGMAGLLDLGFVAFFAAGAYTVAMFGSPVSPVVHGTINYWFLLPLAIGVGALLGVGLGLPVLPLRGDYLAIVTLGFGEIIRILALNMTNYTNGSSGLFQIARPDLGYRHIDDVQSFYVFVLFAALLVWFVTTRLRDSRVGRAWEAIREDEDVAAAMGINTTRYKLMAFAIGASVGALGGAIYAPFIDFVAPQSFTLQVSINVLALVIIGGMGNTLGVIAGAAILIGVPELAQFSEVKDLLGHLGWLREVLNAPIHGINQVAPFELREIAQTKDWGDDLALYRYVFYGALMVTVMVLRPSGLFPSKRRELEFENPPEAELAAGASGGGT